MGRPGRKKRSERGRTAKKFPCIKPPYTWNHREGCCGARNQRGSLFHKPGGGGLRASVLSAGCGGAPCNEKGTRVTRIQDQRTLMIRGPRGTRRVCGRKLRKGFRQAAVVAAKRKAVVRATLVRHSTVKPGPWNCYGHQPGPARVSLPPGLKVLVSRASISQR